jgi:SAM-dependent methyltransferase
MSGRRHLSDLDYWEQLMPIEGKLAHGSAGELPELFAGINDDLFAYLLLRDFHGFPRILEALPRWPSQEHWQAAMGKTPPNESLKEGVSFWSTVKLEYEKLTGNGIESARVLDYGAGVGRITRLCAKDISSDQLFAAEPSDGFCLSIRESGLPCTVIETDWESRVPLPVNGFSLVLAFAIFSHASPELAGRIMSRLAEVTTSGAIIALTVRPAALLQSGDGEAVLFSSEERAHGLDDYKRGLVTFKPYDAGSNWGVSIVPVEWFHENCSNSFEIIGARLLLQNWTQKLVLLRRL